MTNNILKKIAGKMKSPYFKFLVDLYEEYGNRPLCLDDFDTIIHTVISNAKAGNLQSSNANSNENKER